MRLTMGLMTIPFPGLGVFLAFELARDADVVDEITHFGLKGAGAIGKGI
jgi:hypothetical protein